MIKYYFIIIFCCFGFLSNAQYDGKGANEISRFLPGFMWKYTGLRPAKAERVNKYDRLIFDITYNDWMGDKEPFQNHWASIGLNTNFIFDIPLTKGNKVSLGLGVAHQFVNIRHDDAVIIDDVENTTSFTPMASVSGFEKSVLSGNSFSLPIELRFRNEGWRHFKVHIGGKIGYQANLLSKYVAKVDGHRVVNKRYGFPDENKLIYSAHARIGLRNWALFASYNFNTFFSNPKSAQLNLVQMGLSISLY